MGIDGKEKPPYNPGDITFFGVRSVYSLLLAIIYLAFISLGLPIAQEILRQHGGRIWAKGGDGCNMFYVNLPEV